MRLALALSLSWCLTFASWALLWVIFANGEGWQWWYDLEYRPNSSRSSGCWGHPRWLDRLRSMVGNVKEEVR